MPLNTEDLKNTKGIAFLYSSIIPNKSINESIEMRNILSTFLQDTNNYLIEDGYNSELDFKSKIQPALQSFFPDQTIYMGSFSRLLMPSVRISYMICPVNLTSTLKDKLSNYTCTSSKI